MLEDNSDLNVASMVKVVMHIPSTYSVMIVSMKLGSMEKSICLELLKKLLINTTKETIYVLFL